MPEKKEAPNSRHFYNNIKLIILSTIHVKTIEKPLEYVAFYYTMKAYVAICKQLHLFDCTFEVHGNN